MKEENNILHLPTYLNSDQELPSFVSHMHKPEEKPKSHLVKRAIAFGVDLLSIAVIKTAIQTSFAIFISEFFVGLSPTYKSHLMNTPMHIHALTFIAIYLSYFIYTSYVFNGKTLGKMTMGLSIINENFLRDQDSVVSSITLKQAAQRAFGYLICYLSFGTFFIFNFSTEDKRGLPDYLSSTRTVSDKWLQSMTDFKKYQKDEVLIDIKSLEISSAA